MTNHRLGRNILLGGGIVTLVAALIPWKNKDTIGQVLFGLQSILFFTGAYLQQKEVHKTKRKEDQ